MSTLRCFVSSALLVLAGLGAARAAEKVLVPGNPPLTQGMVNDYCQYVEWRWPQALSKLGGPQRLEQLIVNDWKNGDRARQQALLANLKWWREDFPRLSRAEREQLRQAPGADARLSARDQEAIARQMLEQWNEAQQLQLRALSDLQAKHHETMMLIINNLRPSGRFEYNPATGRYDRYAPDPRK
jgi:hypothetical protein